MLNFKKEKDAQDEDEYLTEKQSDILIIGSTITIIILSLAVLLLIIAKYYM